MALGQYNSSHRKVHQVSNDMMYHNASLHHNYESVGHLISLNLSLGPPFVTFVSQLCHMP